MLNKRLNGFLVLVLCAALWACAPSEKMAVENEKATDTVPANNAENEPKAKMEVELGKYVTTKDSIILIGVEVTTRPPDWSVLSLGFPTIQDANGRIIENKYPEAGAMGIDLNYGVDRGPWVTEFKTEGVAFPITITQRYRVFEPASEEEMVVLKIDVGHDAGQVIEVNESFFLANDKIMLKTITVGENNYSFEYAMGKFVSSFNTTLLDCDSYGGGGTGIGFKNPERYFQTTVCEERPKGELTIIIDGAMIGHEIEETSIQWSPN